MKTFELQDKQLVWAYDSNDSIGYRVLGFYDKKSNSLFSEHGIRGGAEWNYYEPYLGDEPKWAEEVRGKLDD